ncbi:endo-1,4-beta-xylanase [Foetidibacter luteolus]|uniref:endo-1,4-beta-xylanase n=1 Tax=Foetidibacter luteolus TaxID=2608880 RepID=UPI00129BBB02|nr:endo-1,4-beta-xylanase [Foetidibacter luteolus]
MSQNILSLKHSLTVILFVFLCTSCSSQPQSATAMLQRGKKLKEAYKDYFPIGVALDIEELRDTSIQKLVTDQFSSITAKKVMQPMRIHAKEKEYNWAPADSMVNFAVQNNLKIRGHCLVYNIHMPRWFWLDENKKPAGRELLLARMKSHITAEVSRYKGKVYCWDVVNEALRDNDTLLNRVGEDYIDSAFFYAKAADPDAILFYNDGIYTAAHMKKIGGLMKRLKERGVPVDGIGIQGHLGIDGFDKDEMQSFISNFSAMGLQVQITELDISVYDRMSTPEKLLKVPDTFSTNMSDKQARIFGDLFKLFRNNKDKITGVTIWGIKDGNSFLEQKLKRKNYPYLFNAQGQPKKSFQSVTMF